MVKYVRCIKDKSEVDKRFDLEKNKIYKVISNILGCYQLEGFGDKQYIKERFITVLEEDAIKEGIVTKPATAMKADVKEHNNSIFEDFKKSIRDNSKFYPINLDPLFDDNQQLNSINAKPVLIKDLALEIAELVERKNKDYNNSYAKTIDKYGYATYFIRIQDKINRLENLLLNGHNDSVGEKVEDTLDDIIGYTLLTKEYILNKR